MSLAVAAVLRLCQCCQLMCGVVFIFTNGGCDLTQVNR
jgi:hypothetical protein